MAVVQVLLSGCRVGLFDKVLDAVDVCLLNRGRGGTQVTIGGFGSVGQYPQQDDLASGRLPDGLLQGLDKSDGVGHSVVRWGDHQDRISVDCIGTGWRDLACLCVVQCSQSCQCQCSGCVAWHGFQQRSAFGMNYAVANGWVGDDIPLIIEFEAIRK
jgi:hypothetical protein